MRSRVWLSSDHQGGEWNVGSAGCDPWPVHVVHVVACSAGGVEVAKEAVAPNIYWISIWTWPSKQKMCVTKQLCMGRCGHLAVWAPNQEITNFFFLRPADSSGYFKCIFFYKVDTPNRSELTAILLCKHEQTRHNSLQNWNVYRENVACDAQLSRMSEPNEKASISLEFYFKEQLTPNGNFALCEKPVTLIEVQLIQDFIC